jgi:hypothetical protein
MVPHEAKNDFNEIIGIEMFEMNRTLSGAMAATQSRLIAKGLGTSGPAMQLLVEDATNSLKARAQYILGQLLRCLAAHQVRLDETTLPEAIALLRDTIDVQSQVIRSKLFGFPVFQTNGLEGARHQLEAQYAQESPRLIKRLTTELRLAMAASKKDSNMAASSTNMTFNGPVGLIQTGDGSQAAVTQHIDLGTRTQLLSVLQSYIDELDKVENHSMAGREELKEMVLETKDELEKAKPNSLKIGSGLRTIAETSKFIGSLGPAYQVLKPLLSYFGIHLP